VQRQVNGAQDCAVRPAFLPRALVGRANIASSLLNLEFPPMNREGKTPLMFVNIEVSDEIRREAESRAVPLVDFVETLVDKGLAAEIERNSVATAIERIRALRSFGPESGA
jgi:hypothetical protein